MKRLSLITLSLCLAQTLVYSQIKRGTISTGGDISFSHSKREIAYYTISVLPTKPDYYRNTTAHAAFQASYFIIDRLSVGLVASYSMSQSSYSFDEWGIRGSKFGIGPTARYYFQVNKILIFPHATFSYEKYHRYFKAARTFAADGTTYSISIGPGISVSDLRQSCR